MACLGRFHRVNMKTIPFKILGKDWKLLLVAKKRFKNKGCSDTIAYTSGDDRKIFLGSQGKGIETIRHELVHAFLAELCLGSTDLDNDNLEEIYADFMAKRGRELLDLADVLLDLIQDKE